MGVFLQSPQDIRVGGRAGKGQFQYALQSGDLDELSYLVRAPNWWTSSRLDHCS